MLDPSFGTSPSKLNFNRSNFEGFSLFSGTELTGIINSLINNSKFTIDNYTYIPRPYILSTAIGIAYGFKYCALEFSYFAQSKSFTGQTYYPIYGSIRLTAKW